MIGGLVVAGVVTAAAAYWLLTLGGGSDSDSKKRPAVAQVADAAPVQVQVVPDAAAVAPTFDAAPALAKYVTIQVDGPPAGTEVYGPGGGIAGVAPGPIQLDRAETKVQLIFKKVGYRTKTVRVSAKSDGQIEVELVKKRARRPGNNRKPTNSRNSIESPF
jgi:hypothetical protein